MNLWDSFEGLWDFVGVSSNYLHIKPSSQFARLLGSVEGLWELVGLSFGYLNSKHAFYFYCMFIGGSLGDNGICGMSSG